MEDIYITDELKILYWRRYNMQNILELFGNHFRGSDGVGSEGEPLGSKYPLEALGKYVGKIIEVHQLDGTCERAVLKLPPGDEFFYLGSSPTALDRHIVYWDREQPQNMGRSAVARIMDEDGTEIYRNSEFFETENN
ncbi:MAG: hypothetical protein KAJ24_02285 [Candidatus Aenigmarchaeota archaeon]|nr:hypothetical protein [Candidatus Aenigmarchaeota archaeon]